MNTPGGVEVNARSFPALSADPALPLALDSYQRDFAWTGERMRQLVDDLRAYRTDDRPKPPYYMGTVLLHRHASKARRFIIDGQQRLTALCVLHRWLTGQLPPHCGLVYSLKSARQIRAVADVLRDPGLAEAKRRLTPPIFAEIVFTVVTVDREDMAFTFFDTQNNRGVPLYATNLLKAYHLRAITAATLERCEDLQTRCAQCWESIQQGVPVVSAAAEFTSSLFTLVLWRAHAWTGNQVKPGG